MNDTLAAYVMILLVLVPAAFAVLHLHVGSLPVTPKEK